ncbi:MAG: 3-dehydroquinate dehydratase [Ignavibacteria bacterium RBG_16_34_14]|nr:MAG: 3-dehydroquinate dehydratase [Ignavibacteria bacterium RBG_16_34_14]
MKIICINGANLNLLGKRNKSHYGKFNLSNIESLLRKEFPKISFSFFHSNIEGEIVSIIQEASSKYDGLIINPGGYAHTSIAIRDALEFCTIPKVEVHLSHLAKREDFRQKLITASCCDGYISGFKEYSYLAGVYLIQKLINNKKKV